MRHLSFGPSELRIAGALLLTMLCALALGAAAIGAASGSSGDPSFAWQALPYLRF